jgi:gas vesicle structural protein
MTMQPSSGGAVERSEETGLADVVTTILDKGVVIDVFARVSLVGIEVLRADARVVIASVDTYLRFAEAVNRLEMGTEEPSGLKEITEEASAAGSRGKSKGALDAAAEKVGELLQPEEDEREEQAVGRRERAEERG